MTTSRGITDTRVYDREGVVERYGIPPELVTDFIGLKGDTSDNIPGVPGIGDKTAAQLLQKYGSLESVLEHIDEISGEKRRQNLRENADLARISKSLATLHRGIDAGRGRGRDRGPRARPLAAARGVHPLRAARPAAPAGGGAGRAGGGAAGGGRAAHRGRAARDARPPGIAELGDEVGAGGQRADGEALRWAAHDGGRAGARRLGRDARGGAGGLGRPAPGRPRLEDARAATPATARRPVAEVRLVERHDGGGIPDRPRAPALPAGRAARPGRHRAGRRGRRRRPRGAAVGVRALSADQQEADRPPRAARAAGRHRAAAGRRPLPARAPGRKARHLPAGRDRGPRLRGDRRARAPDLRAGRRGVHDRLSAAARPRSCSRSWSCRASGAARPASRPTPACCARSARSTRSSRRSSGGAS